MKAKGEIVQQILQALKDLGPMTGAEIATAIGYGQRRTHGITQRLRKTLSKKPKRIYVCGYIFDNEGQRNYPRAVFDIGDKEDVAKPKSNPKTTAKKYRQKSKERVNSVWMLGMTRDEKRSSMRFNTKTGRAPSQVELTGQRQI